MVKSLTYLAGALTIFGIHNEWHYLLSVSGGLMLGFSLAYAIEFYYEMRAFKKRAQQREDVDKSFNEMLSKWEKERGERLKKEAISETP